MSTIRSSTLSLSIYLYYLHNSGRPGFISPKSKKVTNQKDMSSYSSQYRVLKNETNPSLPTPSLLVLLHTLFCLVVFAAGGSCGIKHDIVMVANYFSIDQDSLIVFPSFCIHIFVSWSLQQVVAVK